MGLLVAFEVCFKLEKHLSLDKHFVPALQIFRRVPHVFEEFPQVAIVNSVGDPVRSICLPRLVEDLDLEESVQPVGLHKQVLKVKVAQLDGRESPQRFECMANHEAEARALLHGKLEIHTRTGLEQGHYALECEFQERSNLLFVHVVETRILLEHQRLFEFFYFLEHHSLLELAALRSIEQTLERL